ncbi:hypothetical protein L1887_55744 [Cichorium endivia]|nr:hypothetical protein L1887_55744 [Cichorium endivia]
MCKCRSHGTFPLFGLQSSHLNICYYHQDPHRRPLRPGSRPRFCSDRRALPTHRGLALAPDGPGVGRALKRHPFSGLVDSAVSLRASTRVSSGFAPLRHSSPSFGSRQGMLTLEPFSEDQGRSAVHPARGIPPISFLAPCGFTHPLTRTHVRLLGPCFKTGRMGCPQAGAGEHAGISPRRRVLPTTIDATASPRAYRQLGLWPPHQSAPGSGHDGALTLSGAPFQGTWARSAAEDASPDYNSDSEAVRFSSWADPGFDNDPSAGSPTETLLRLLLPLNDKVQWNSRDVARRRTAHVAAILTLHRTIQSVGATGGVYKGQGRSQRELMTRAY